MPGAPETKFSNGMYFKTNFAQELNSGDIKLDCTYFLNVLGDTCYEFCCRAGLKFHGLSGLPGGTTELRERTSGTLKCLFPGLKPKTMSHEP